MLDEIKVPLFRCLKYKAFDARLLEGKNLFSNQPAVALKFWRLLIHPLNIFKGQTDEGCRLQALDGIPAWLLCNKRVIMRSIMAFRIKSNRYFIVVFVNKKRPDQACCDKPNLFLNFSSLKKNISFIRFFKRKPGSKLSQLLLRKIRANCLNGLQEYFCCRLHFSSSNFDAYFNEAISITNRYFTSPFNMRSYASLI